MSLIYTQILAALEQGGTVVVPSRQRAVALSLAYTRARLAGGSGAWPSPDVCTWPTWLERCAERNRRGVLRGQRRLGAGEEWLLWREAAEQACEGTGVLEPAGLADSLRRSSALQSAWNLRWTGAAASEYAVLQRARAGLERRCRDLRAYSASDWALLLQEGGASEAPPLFAGFGPLGTALEGRLRSLGALLPATAPRTADVAVAAGARVVAGVDRADELRLAAQWCREKLEQDPAARLLVVVPQLAEQRASAIQAFEHALHGGTLLSGRDEALFAIEGGQPLADYPLVGAGLAILALAGAPSEFARVAALLRSPYLVCGSPQQRAELELSLREGNVHAADIALLVALARAQPQGRLSALVGALEAIAPALSVPRNAREGAGWWARRYAAMLDAMGWPGDESLSSEELQQRDRFRELLGELAALEAGGMLMSQGEAFELLRALALRTAFEAENADAPVIVTAAIDDPLVCYEGIWVAGLGADTWPAPPRPDPFLPIAAQRAAGVPAASPQGQLQAALRAMAAWRRCAGELICSWPQFDGEVPLQPSHLLASRLHPDAGTAERAPPPPAPDRLVVAIRDSARHEPRPIEQAIAWPPARSLPGGTRALQLQALCPFRAVAELRLGAVQVPEPLPGLDRRERGEIIHRALELLWRQLGDSRALRNLAADSGRLGELVRAAAAQAIAARLGRRALPLAAALVENEQRRVQALIMALLDQERVRAAAAEFSVAQLEAAQDCELGGLPIRVRPDRLDRLDDGRLLVIDYKSGAAQAFRPLDERPRQPQLLAYALLAAGEVAGIATVHLGADEIRWRGASADPALLPALGRPRAPSAPWPELLAHWRRVIAVLVREFAIGEAAVRPLSGACEYCHLPAFCRIAAAGVPQPEPEVDEADDDAG